MKAEIHFDKDEVTRNGRVYPQEVLEKAYKEAYNKGMLDSIDLENKIAYVNINVLEGD